jgi:hypothetical protein
MTSTGERRPCTRPPLSLAVIAERSDVVPCQRFHHRLGVTVKFHVDLSQPKSMVDTQHRPSSPSQRGDNIKHTCSPFSAATATLRESITSIYRRWPGVIAGFNVGSSRPQNDGYMRVRPPSPTFIQAAGRATHPKKFDRQLGVIDNHLVVLSSAPRASCPRRWSPSPHQTNDDLVQSHSPFCLRVVLRCGRRSGHTNERAHKREGTQTKSPAAGRGVPDRPRRGACAEYKNHCRWPGVNDENLAVFPRPRGLKLPAASVAVASRPRTGALPLLQSAVAAAV